MKETFELAFGTWGLLRLGVSGLERSPVEGAPIHPMFQVGLCLNSLVFNHSYCGSMQVSVGLILKHPACKS